MKNEGVSLEFVEIHENKATNYHYVLWYGDDRTILVKHEEYARHLPDLGKPKWLYLSSLSEMSPFMSALYSLKIYALSLKDACLFFQLGILFNLPLNSFLYFFYDTVVVTDVGFYFFCMYIKI